MTSYFVFEETYEQEDCWALVADYDADSDEEAVDKHVAATLHGGTFVAVPASYWVPITVIARA
jgi:hypothetical protein